MGDQKENIGSSLIRLIQDQSIDLKTIAACADAVAADARFNLWAGTVTKQQATVERMMELIEFYDRVTYECLSKVAAFDVAVDDAGTLEHNLLEIARQLEKKTEESGSR